MLNREELIELHRRNRAALLTERKVEVKTFLVRAGHTGCTGEFIASGEAYMTYPPKYAHVCSGCGQHETFFERYPATRMEEIQ